MKTIIAITTLVLLAGCGSMGHQSSGGMEQSSSGSDYGYGQNYSQPDRTFNSWID